MKERRDILRKVNTWAILLAIALGAGAIIICAFLVFWIFIFSDDSSPSLVLFFVILAASLIVAVLIGYIILYLLGLGPSIFLILGLLITSLGFFAKSDFSFFVAAYCPVLLPTIFSLRLLFAGFGKEPATFEYLAQNPGARYMIAAVTLLIYLIGYIVLI